MRKSYLIVLATVLAVSSLLFQGTVVAGAPLSGAIFTGLEDGGQVNANHYADKRDVYLNAGPPPNAPQDSAGLPDGNYYFQVIPTHRGSSFCPRTLCTAGSSGWRMVG